MIYRCGPCNWDHCSQCAEEKDENKLAKKAPEPQEEQTPESPPRGPGATRTKAAPGKRPETLDRQASLLEVSREESAVDLMQASGSDNEVTLETKRQISSIDLLQSPAADQEGNRKDEAPEAEEKADDADQRESDASKAAEAEPPARPGATGQGQWKRTRQKACVSLDDDDEAGEEPPAKQNATASRAVVDIEDEA